ncbi:hypothetical protein CC85DRAFT_105683 [Cutaneotrichosporon oleaginosum]|uniref:Uncharacterized protein n=1 Tax=Cutaneotrichosporon oleaginosum TaxID=879819 RepID=A0A0J1B2P5_9TREE|nr:uncharacterized protein CC85DRAFT_105683 [Cutaneotrichosporon oleaginosum]KLT41869.1 hypothetical protein CC85DRAFT_105683 [Cutaneotrichosporon oleaginosum]TXT14787.1 hypothetical protein COLE_00980 [Cutaneotrichosporon oleaginosum]
MNPSYPDHNMAYGRPGEADQVMYAPFTYDAPPPPQQSAMYQGYYTMNDPMDPNNPSDFHMGGSAPTRLRARRGPGDRASLEVAVHPYNMDGRMSPTRYSPGIPPMPPIPPKSSLRGKTAEEEEARKARKREMGRERQRRKRLRDKAKREALEHQHHPPGSSTSTLLGRSAGDRSSFTSVSSYEGPSSVSTTYSNLPPMAIPISSPSHSFGMSSSGSMSDMSSPGHLSPTMGGFASDDSSWEHNTMLSTLTLSGGGDATVRASKPRGQSAALSSIAGSRRDSGAEVHGYSTVQSPSKRRKSEAGDHQVGLGVNFGQQDGAGDNEAWRQGRNLRRTESATDNIPIDPALTGESRRSPTPPPLGTRSNGLQGSQPPSSDGNYFASTVVMALSQTQWSGEIQNRLGMDRADLESMGPGLAATYDRWRYEQNRGRGSLDSNGGRVSPSPASPPKPFATPSTRGVGQDNTSASPSTSSNNSHHSMPGLSHRPSSNPTISVASAGRPPQTPKHQQHIGSGSSSNSPAHPTLQTPVSHQGVFPPHDINQTWTAHTARMYEAGWREQYPPPMPGQMMADGKAGIIPPPPIHAPSNAPMPALHSPVTVQPGVFQQTPTQAAPRTFAPNVHPQHGMPGVQMYYGPAGIPPAGVPQAPVHRQPGDEMLQLGAQ